MSVSEALSIEGKKALVTGASGGIGREIARLLGAAGAEVMVTGTRADALQETANLDELKGKCHIFTGDISAPGKAEELITAAEAAMGRLDILVCNAGITRDGLAMRMKDEDFEQVIATNLTANFKMTRGALKGMMKNREGRIIFITSVVGHSGNPGQANYCASKAGLSGMARSLAMEVASRSITVNCVAPGFIATAMTDKLNDEQKARITANIPAGRMGEAHEVANAVLFLSSPMASYITGSTIHVNGGLYM